MFISGYQNLVHFLSANIIYTYMKISNYNYDKNCLVISKVKSINIDANVLYLMR